MTSKELKSLIKGKINGAKIRQGDVFIKDVGYGLGKAVMVAMGPAKQSKGYKNEFLVPVTVLIPPKRKVKGWEKDSERYTTFGIRYGKLTNVPYLGKWQDVSEYFLED